MVPALHLVSVFPPTALSSVVYHLSGLIWSHASLLVPYPLSRLPYGKGKNVLYSQAVAAEVAAVVSGMTGTTMQPEKKALVTLL